MHAFELLKDPAQVAKASFCVVHGDDVFLRRESVAALIRGLLGGQVDDLAVTRFAGEKAGLADVLDELRTLPFLVSRRVAVVEDADPFVTAHRKELEHLVDGPPDAGCADPAREDLAREYQAGQGDRQGRDLPSTARRPRSGSCPHGSSSSRGRAPGPSSIPPRRCCSWSWSAPRSGC